MWEITERKTGGFPTKPSKQAAAKSWGHVHRWRQMSAALKGGKLRPPERWDQPRSQHSGTQEVGVGGGGGWGGGGRGCNAEQVERQESERQNHSDYNVPPPRPPPPLDLSFHPFTSLLFFFFQVRPRPRST